MVLRQAQILLGTNLEENLRPANSMEAPLQQAPLASQADRAAGLMPFGIATWWARVVNEVWRLEQILNLS
ncbi:hypothetical protein AAFG13_38450 [Bradyrhizobium sp. B124]|uniref:hypothetical protein n=1 Tax=Bradyrhizobium sp. B124 TaxID=3140245 RepID=UPI00318365F4